jgi:hypothetical protein
MRTAEMFDSELRRWNMCMRLDGNLAWHQKAVGRAFMPECLAAIFAATPLVSKFHWRSLRLFDHLHRQEIVNRIANILASDQPTSQCR